MSNAPKKKPRTAPATEWTHLHDMSSGGGRKLKWRHIYIEAPEAEAKRVFYAKFHRNPDRVTCTCCGPDYSTSECASLEQATAYERDCPYYHPADPKLRNEGRWFEPDEAIPDGWIASKFGSWRTTPPVPLAEFLRSDDILVVRAEEIGADDRKADVPAEGYVWAGDS